MIVLRKRKGEQRLAFDAFGVDYFKVWSNALKNSPFIVQKTKPETSKQIKRYDFFTQKKYFYEKMRIE